MLKVKRHPAYEEVWDQHRTLESEKAKNCFAPSPLRRTTCGSHGDRSEGLHWRGDVMFVSKVPYLGGDLVEVRFEEDQTTPASVDCRQLMPSPPTDCYRSLNRRGAWKTRSKVRSFNHTESAKNNFMPRIEIRCFSR